MLDFIEKLRKKPEATRARIVFFSAAFVTGVIFIIWLSVLSVQLDTSSSDFSETIPGDMDNTEATFSKLKEDVSEIFSGGKSDLQKFKEEISDEILYETEAEVTSDPPNEDE